MLCRSKGCGAEGLFDKTHGFCPRCDEEINADDDPHFTGYYEKKVAKHEETLPFLAWFAIICFVVFVGRAAWMMFTN